MNTHIEDLICSYINDQFAYINYGKFEKLIINRNNNYVNLTKFVNTFSKKEFSNWRRLNGSEDLMNEVFKNLNSISREEYNSGPFRSEATSNINSNATTIYEPIVDILHVPNELKGTYGHPIILNAVAMWISAEYAVYVHNLIIKWTVQDKDHRISELERLRQDLEKQHEETKSILISTRDNLEELRIEHEDTSFKLDRLTLNMTNLNVNSLSSNQYALPPVSEGRTNALIITGVRYTNPTSNDPSKERYFYIANRTQLDTFKSSRKQMLRRLFSREPYSNLIKSYSNPLDPNSYLVPRFYCSSPNAVNLWTTFRARHMKDFDLEGGKITFLRRRAYYIEDLIRDLYEFAQLEPLPVEELVEKYNEALNSKEED